jgi:hypothetical protein
MAKSTAPTASDLEELDRFYREGGLQAMASPHVHYDDPCCPHPGCDHVLEWIDFRRELHNDPEAIDKPLVRSWWQATGFAGRCPRCQGWIHKIKGSARGNHATSVAVEEAFHGFSRSSCVQCVQKH